MIVYTRNTRCTICAQDATVVQMVHGVIWDMPEGAGFLSPAMRNGDYRIRAKEVLASRDVKLEEKAITRHVEHVERTGRVAVGSRHPSGRKVFDSSYGSMIDKAANLGMSAYERIEERLDRDELEPRELVAVAKAGVAARVESEKLSLRQHQQSLVASALFAIAGGFLQELPGETGMVINVTELEMGLRDDLESERDTLVEAAGHPKRIAAGVQEVGGDAVTAGRPDRAD